MWVIGEFSGKKAKSALDHASHGIGYIILDEGGSGHNPTCMAAFRRVSSEPLPDHLTEVTDSKKIDELERRRKAMQGLQR